MNSPLSRPLLISDLDIKNKPKKLLTEARDTYYSGFNQAD